MRAQGRRRAAATDPGTTAPARGADAGCQELLSGLLRIRPVDDHDSHADQYQRDNREQGTHRVRLSEEYGRHRGSENGRHETEDTHAAHRVDDEELRPEGICHGRDKAHVDDERDRWRWRGGREAPTHGNAAYEQDDAAYYELPSGERDGIVGTAENGDKAGRERSGDGAEQDESLAAECERNCVATGTAEVYENHAGKADGAAHKSLAGKALGSKDECGKEDGEEIRGSADNRAGDACGVGKAAVEKEILQHGLKEREDTDGTDVAPPG